jgi:tetratricopeptide (TPR) repeat protein
MNRDQFNELIALRNAGNAETVIPELAKFSEAETDVATKALILWEISNSLGMLNRFSDSRDKLREADRLVGRRHSMSLRIALAFAQLDIEEGKWKHALRKLDKLAKEYDLELNLDENSDVKEQVSLNRGIALVEVKRFQEALQILLPLRSIEHGRERALYSLGACQFELKQFEAAQLDFEELLSLSPSSIFQAYAHYYLGKILYQFGQLARAKSELEACLACSDRGNVSEKIVLQGLLYCSQGLNLNKDAAAYSEKLKNL